MGIKELHFIFRSGLGCITVLLSACGGGSGPVQPALTASPVNLTCVDYAQVSTNIGTLTNNVWNRQAAGSFAYSQCLTARNRNTSPQYGWSWSWPTNSGSVFSYPEVVLGWKPWNGGQTTVPSLPIRVNAINNFSWSYAVEVHTTGIHDIATSMWLTSNGATSNNVDTSHLTTEFMIWSDGYAFSPAGNMVGQVGINGVNYEVWSDPNQTDASGQNSNVWKYVAYRMTSPQLSVTLDIKAILNDAVSRGLVTAADYVSDIELGTEVMSGSGNLWVDSLTLNVN